MKARKLVCEKVIPSDPALLDDAVEEITAGLSGTAHWRDVEDIALAVGEALANAIVHGNRCDPEKTGVGSIQVGFPTQLLRRICWPRMAGAYS